MNYIKQGIKFIVDYSGLIVAALAALLLAAAIRFANKGVI